MAGSAQILYYEPLRAHAAATAAAAQKQTGEFSYSFDAFGHRFDLKLTRNERIALLKPTASEGPAVRLYQGKLEGIEDSWVRLGARGEQVQGMVWDGHELYVIEPVESARNAVAPPLALPDSGAIVFRLSDTQMLEPASCASVPSPRTPSGLDAYTAVVAELKTAASAIVASNPTRRIELSVIGDALYRQRHASNQTARDEILLRLNNVDGIYSSQIGVAIQVPTVIVEAPGASAFSTTSASNTLLGELASLRESSPELNSRGLTHLFTGRDLDGDTVGVAYIDALCHRRLGVGLTQAYNLNVWIESLIAAHELGHNFGAYHDGEDPSGNNAGECAGTPDNLYLMAPRVDADHQQFSACSRTTIRNRAFSRSCVTAISTADIAVASDLGQARAIAGTTFEWSFDVANVGSATATAANAKAFLPPSITIVEVWVTGGTCTAGAGLIDCSLGDVTGGVTRTINARLHSEQLASNTAAVHVSAGNDAGLNNNDGQGNIEVEADVDLAIELAAPGYASVAETMTGSFVVRNLSSFDAQALALDFTAPPGLTLRSITLAGADCVSNTDNMHCTLDTLAPDAVLGGTIAFDASTPGSFTLTAAVSSVGLDGNPANNTVDAAIQFTSGISAAAGTKSSGGGGALGWELLVLSLLWPAARRAGSGHRSR